jgi:hypothetical protein
MREQATGNDCQPGVQRELPRDQGKKPSQVVWFGKRPEVHAPELPATAGRSAAGLVWPAAVRRLTERKDAASAAGAPCASSRRAWPARDAGFSGAGARRRRTVTWPAIFTLPLSCSGARVAGSISNSRSPRRPSSSKSSSSSPVASTGWPWMRMTMASTLPLRWRLPLALRSSKSTRSARWPVTSSVTRFTRLREKASTSPRSPVRW